METRSHLSPKRGNTSSECEDAFAVDSVLGRFAIADGASGSLFQGIWAQLLVDQFIRMPVRWEQRWRDWLPPLQQRWIEILSTRSIEWNEDEQFEQGAFATFLALRIDPVSCQRWWSLAIGDSCLFHVRDKQLLATFPMTTSEVMCNDTHLIGSRTPVKDVITEREVWRTGQCASGDHFFMATDALARWFLQQCESGCFPWQTLLDICQPSKDTFAVWIEELRMAHKIRDDDVTLVIVEV